MFERINNNYWQAVVAILFGMLLLAQVSKADDLPDPTRPAQFQGVENADNYRLESILNSSQRRVAIINGKVLAVGDKLGDAQLQTIGSNRVTLRVGNKIIPLQLQQQAVKKEVSKR